MTKMSATNEQQIIARAFLSARAKKTPLTLYPGAMPESMAEAYAIQDAAIGLDGRMIGGWKVGRIAAELVDTYGDNRLTGPIFADAYSGIGLLDPSAAGDDAVLEGYVRSTVGGWYHPTGTCAMGTVVDGRLAVHGVEGLHVVDASIMPTIVRAPTNLSSIAIGERAADLLR